MSEKLSTSRRDFLKAGSLLTVGAGLSGALNISRNAYAAGNDEIRIALIGCGSRGGGAIRDRLAVGDNVKVIAMADAYEVAAKRGTEALREDEEFGSKVDISDDHIFHGLDAYKKAIDVLRPGIDQVVIANPPGFRPYQYRYAMEKGVHVFMEKPCATDVQGYKILMEANKIADEKNLKVCVGLQRRHDPGYQQWVEKVHEGVIGDISYTRIFWNGTPPWCRLRKPGDTEMQYQVNNWYHFHWLCGDNIVEQHIHNIDMGVWLHSGKEGNLCHPVEANGLGGRQESTGPASLLQTAPPFSDRKEWDKWYQSHRDAFSRQGQAWDHFFVEYTFSDGSRMFSQCRHIHNCWNAVGQGVFGTKGFGESEYCPAFLKDYNTGKEVFKTDANSWQFRLEHVKHVEAIRQNKPMNNGWFAAMSSMTAVLGREATYAGHVVYWDDLVEKGKINLPDEGYSSFDETPPVVPDENGFYESSIPQQGRYNPFA